LISKPAEMIAEHDTSNKAAKKLKKPKRNISAFHIFSKEMHATLNGGGEKINPNKRMSLISEKWANLPQNEKNAYIEKAKLDKWRYLNELNEFYSSEAATVEAPAKSKPKKFGNAFTFFLREKKLKLKEAQPHLSMSEIMSMVAKEWRNLGKAAKQKYLDASEEDKKRYKTEVCEMSRKAKPAKNQRKKKLLRNAKNLEKTMDDLMQYSVNLVDATTVKKQADEEPKSAQKSTKILKFPYESSFRLSRTGSSRKASYIEDWLPKMEERHNSIFFDKELPVRRDMSIESLIFPKLEHIEGKEKPQPIEHFGLRNQSSFRNNSAYKMDFMEYFNFGAKNSQLFSKVSENMQNLPNLASSFQLSFLERNRSNSIKEILNANAAAEGQSKPKKGRGFLNGVLESALDSDLPVLSLNDFMGIGMNSSLSNEKLIDSNIFITQSSTKE